MYKLDLFVFLAGTTLNVSLLKIAKQANRAEFQLNLDLSSIIKDFETIAKQNLEAIQVKFPNFSLSCY